MFLLSFIDSPSPFDLSQEGDVDLMSTFLHPIPSTDSDTAPAQWRPFVLRLPLLWINPSVI